MNLCLRTSHPQCPAPEVPPPGGLGLNASVAPSRAGTKVSNAPRAQNLTGTRKSVVKINTLMQCFLKQLI